MLQKHLKDSQLSTTGATFTRFLYGAPLAAALALVLTFGPGWQLPRAGPGFLAFAMVGGLAQILATNCVIALFAQRNFAIGIGSKKTATIQTALLTGSPRSQVERRRGATPKPQWSAPAHRQQPNEAAKWEEKRFRRGANPDSPKAQFAANCARFLKTADSKVFKTFPEAVMDRVNAALAIAAEGGKAGIAKPLKGFGPDVTEIAIRYRTDAWRLVYVTEEAGRLWVIHAFRKKLKSGTKTPKAEIDLVGSRLARLKRELLR